MPRAESVIGCPFRSRPASFRPGQPLRWLLATAPGTYDVEMDVQPDGQAAAANAKFDLVVNGARTTLTAAAAGTSTIKTTIHIAEPASTTSIELTPPEPFLKGTSLAVAVTALRLSPRGGNR